MPQCGSGSDSTLAHQYPDVQRLAAAAAAAAATTTTGLWLDHCASSDPLRAKSALSPLEDEPVPDRRLPRDSTSDSLERALRHTMPRGLDGASANSERSLPPSHMSHGATLPAGVGTSGAGSSLIFSANLKKRGSKLGSLTKIFGGKSGSREKGSLRGGCGKHKKSFPRFNLRVDVRVHVRT